MPAIEGYIEKCHPENSTVDRGVNLHLVIADANLLLRMCKFTPRVFFGM